MDAVPVSGFDGGAAVAGVVDPGMKPQTGSGNAEASSAALPLDESSEAGNLALPASNETAQGPAASGEAPSDASAEQFKDPILEAFEAQYAAVKGDTRDFNKLVGLISAAEKLVSVHYLVDHSPSFQAFSCAEYVNA
jgi:hypothetical protein